MLDSRWPSVVDVGPVLKQHWVNVLCDQITSNQRRSLNELRRRRNIKPTMDQLLVTSGWMVQAYPFK